ncbi:MAG: hypothetical protein MSC30_10375 [Gaiellaceae bacterium MAG52_C11]|nr:hypothetical protein [Candidatus Gaiellasilicea maunaloa]
MRRTLKAGALGLLAATALVVGLTPAGAQGTSPGTATANLRSVGGSGITATLNFVDDGSTLSVTGQSSGMSPLGQYVSLVYGLRSNADVTGGTPPGPCVDDGTLVGGAIDQVAQGAVLFSPTATARMLLGAWPLLGVNRTVTFVKPTASPAGVKLNQVKTVSIRQPVLPLLPNIFLDIRPQIFNIRACGLIVGT